MKDRLCHRPIANAYDERVLNIFINIYAKSHVERLTANNYDEMMLKNFINTIAKPHAKRLKKRKGCLLTFLLEVLQWR